MRRKIKISKHFSTWIFLIVILLIVVYMISPALVTEPITDSMVTTQNDKRQFTDSIHVNEITNTHFLELVNLDYSVNDAQSNSLTGARSAVSVLSKDITLNKTALVAVNEMFTAAREVNAGAFYISSGFRDYANQKQTYEDETDKSYAQPAGHSEHETGLAVDIMARGVTQSLLASSPQGHWLSENAWKYGLILRYPQGKQNITGIPYESWHFQYICQPHAWYCMQHNMCFEEYIQFLKNNGGYSTTLDGKKYTVMYETAKNGIIHVPKSQKYTISDDNTGGYIVTAWE